MRLLLAATMAMMLMAATVRADVPTFELELRLVHALGQASEDAADGRADTGPSLLLDFSRTGDRWERIWGINSEMRRPQFYTGIVTDARIADQRIGMSFSLRERGGFDVEVDLQRADDGRLSGTYTLTSRHNTLRGEAFGSVKPQRPPLPEGFAQAQPEERPRILFRRSDLPALRQKAQTPLGQVLVERMGGAIGFGVRYQLTGEREWADKAREATENHMAWRGGYSMRQAWGTHPEAVALAYDLCHEAWPEDFRREVEEWMLRIAQRYRFERMDGGINWHACSNWGARIYGGYAFAALALWGGKGPMPERPEGEDADRLMPFWEFDVAEWRRLGEIDMHRQRLFEESRYLMYLVHREGAGTGGFRGENAHYGLFSLEMTVRYADVYHRMFGRHVSAWPDVRMVLPRKMFANYFPAEWQPFGEEGEGGRRRGPQVGKPVPLDIHGISALWGTFLTHGFALAPAEWQPAALWAWNRQFGVTGPDGLARGIESGRVSGNDTGSAVFLFLNYPIDMEPQHPRQVMPLTWQAPDFGYYGFRNSWAGEDDFIFQIYGREKNVGGWSGPNTGTFRLFGLGHSWNQTQIGREIVPWEENRVMLVTEEELGTGSPVRAIHINTEADGSGAVSYDTSDLYNGRSRGLFSLYGTIRYPGALEDRGVRAVRAAAIDYSGRSGAPCLFVLVDRIEGAPEQKIWTWNLGDADVVERVTVDGNSFTVPRQGATMRGTFITPGDVQVEPKVFELARQARAGPEVRRIPSIHATGGDQFFLVATIQPEGTEPPAIEVRGSGDDTVVLVGGRQIRFDGQTVMIEDR